VCEKIFYTRFQPQDRKGNKDACLSNRSFGILSNAWNWLKVEQAGCSTLQKNNDSGGLTPFLTLFLTPFLCAMGSDGLQVDR